MNAEELASYEAEQKELRRIATYDQDGLYARRALSITVRNPSRPGIVAGTRMGAWGRNVTCLLCHKDGVRDELIHWNNESGVEADKRAKIAGAEHLRDHHPEHFETIQAGHRMHLAEMKALRARLRAEEKMKNQQN